MNMIRHDYVLVYFESQISLLQQEQLFLCNPSVYCRKNFGGTQFLPGNVGQEAPPVKGADRNEICAGGTVIEMLYPGMFSLGHKFFHHNHLLHYTVKSADRQYRLRTFRVPNGRREQAPALQFFNWCRVCSSLNPNGRRRGWHHPP